MSKRLSIMFIVMMALVPMMVAHAQEDEACSVTVEADSRIFAAPDEIADVLGITTRDATFDVIIQTGNGWYRIVTANGKAGGWVQTDELDCEDLLETTEEQPELIALDVTGTVSEPRVNVRQGPGLSFARVGRVVEGDELNIIAQSDAELPWYLVEHEELGLVWVRSDLVTLGELDEDAGLVVIAIDDEEQSVSDAPAEDSTATSNSDNGNRPDTLSVDDNATIVGGRWSHTSTLLEHGCTMEGGPQPGSTSVIGFTLTPSVDESSVTITYNTGTSFTLYRGTGRTYSGSYGSSASIRVSVTFNTPITYTGSETVIHPPNAYRDSECIVRSSWAGRKG